MKMNLGILQPDSKKRINFNIEEQYEKEIIGTNNLSGTKRYDLLPDFTGMSEAEVVSYLNSNLYFPN